MRDVGYKQSKPPAPEIGICLDFLNKPSISWDGYFYICNRYDPDGEGIIGDCNTESLEEIWNSVLRNTWLEYHKRGQRDFIDLCSTCTFWGLPTNG
jgi:radical SAM protein with 4Fe4S-binding SPASM domain